MATDLSKITPDNYLDYLDQLTPEEIRQLNTMPLVKYVPNPPAPVPAHPNGPGVNPAGEYPYTPNPTAPRPDTTQGMNSGELLAAGAGKFADDILKGLGNKADVIGSWYQDPPKAEATMARINAEKAEKNRIDAQLMQNPAAILGNILPNVAAGALTPANLPAQMTTQGVLGALPSPTNPIKGPLSEFTGSAIKGGIDAGATYLGGKAFELAGKGVNAVRGRYTPEGQDALAYDAAAQRLGMDRAELGELAPLGTAGQLNKLSSEYAQRTKDQGDKLRTALSNEVQTAEGPRQVPFGAYKDELTDAAKARFKQAEQKYDAVDQYVIDNGLGNISPVRTFNKLGDLAQKFTPQGRGHDANPLFQRLLDYDPSAFSWLERLGQNPSPRFLKQTLDDGVLPSNYHEMRVAVNKAWQSLNRDVKAPGAPAHVREMRDELGQLKTALDADAAAWATQNAGNTKAMELYKNADDFWKTVVAPAVLENPLSQRLLSRNRGFPTGVSVLGATTGNVGKEEASLLKPTLTARGADMLRALEGPLPHSPNPVAEYLKTGALPNSQGSATMAATAAGMAMPGRTSVILGSPLRTVGTFLGNLSGLSKSDLLKRAYFGQRPEGLGARLGYGAMQLPDEKVEQGLEQALGQRSR